MMLGQVSQLSRKKSQTDPAIAKVIFYAANQPIGTATASPFSIQWGNIGGNVGQLPAQIEITAVATDTSGNKWKAQNTVTLNVTPKLTVSFTSNTHVSDNYIPNGSSFVEVTVAGATNTTNVWLAVKDINGKPITTPSLTMALESGQANTYSVYWQVPNADYYTYVVFAKDSINATGKATMNYSSLSSSLLQRMSIKVIPNPPTCMVGTLVTLKAFTVFMPPTVQIQFFLSSSQNSTGTLLGNANQDNA